MSTIAAGITPGTALVSTANTDGTLQLQVNGTTPAVTLNTAGAVGVGSTPAYGTSGQVLVSGGNAAAPVWTSQSALTVGSATNATTATTATSATTATNLAGGSAGTLPYQSATGTTAMLATGTSGQVLTSQGIAAPTWATPSSDYVLLSTTTVASATNAVNITSPFTNTYKHFLVVVNNLLKDGVTGQVWGLRVYRGGSVVTTSTYSWVYAAIGGTPSSTYNDTSIFLGWNASLTNPTQGYFYLWNAFGPNPNNMFIQGAAVQQPGAPTSNNSATVNLNAYNYDTGTFSGIRFYNLDTTYGYVAAGTVFYVYGIK